MPRIINIEGDYFDAREIIAITVDETSVFVQVRGVEDCFEFVFDTKDQAKEAQLKAVHEWMKQ